MKNDDDQRKQDKEEKTQDAGESEVQETVNDIDLRVSELEQEITEIESKYKRALADYQNLEKRVLQDKAEWLKLTNRDLLLHFLPVLDTLILAYTHSKNDALKVSIMQFRDVLKSEGLTKIEAVGEKFDPHLMEAVDTVPGKEGEVIEEVREGYILHDKLLRPSQVRVGDGDKKSGRMVN